jgi:hypothetical protein
LPRVHWVVSLLKRWLLGTHQGAVSIEHLDYYLDEFTFRFNRRKSRSRGKLFFRLVQQAVAAEPTTYRSIIESARTDWSPNHNLQPCARNNSRFQPDNRFSMAKNEELHPRANSVYHLSTTVVLALAHSRRRSAG